MRERFVYEPFSQHWMAAHMTFQTTKNPPKRVFLTIRILPAAVLAMVDLP